VQRLMLAWKLLRDPSQRKISDITTGSDFLDISYSTMHSVCASARR